MTKDVLISISGLHYEVSDEEREAMPVEMIMPGSYYCKNGKHYIMYDEVSEGMAGSIKNTMKITGDSLFEMKKSGNMAAHMVFEKDQIHMTNYATPFGEMLVGIHTRDMRVNLSEEAIDVRISYSLDIDDEPLSDCEMKIKIRGVH